MKRTLVILAAVAALIGGGVAAVAATTSTPHATCSHYPAITQVTGGSRIHITCTVPNPSPTATVTATQTVTVTADPSSSPSPTTAPSPTDPTSTPVAPSSSPTVNTSGVCQPGSEIVKFTGDGSAGLQQYGQGDYDASAEEWGVSGYNYAQTMGVCSHSSWYVNVTTDNSKGDGAVKAYPSMRRIYHDWGAADFSGDPKLSSFPYLKTTFAQTDPSSCSGCIYDDAFDIWLNGIANSTSNELMIWTHNANQTPYGNKVASGISLAGHTWDLWTDNTNSYIAFVPTDVNNIPSGTFDLKDFTTYLANHGRIPSASTLGQISYGVETVSTGAVQKHWDFTQFSIDDGVNAP